jgi:hypothetical protein
MKTFQPGPDLGPGHAGLQFCHPDQEQGKPAECDMGTDAVGFRVLHQHEGQRCLHGPARAKIS